MNRAALRRGVADRAHVLDRMHARELIVARERCFMPDEKLLDARGDELILDCAEALRAFRVAAPHVVLEAIRVRDESGRHGAAIIADQHRALAARSIRLRRLQPYARRCRARTRSSCRAA